MAKISNKSEYIHDWSWKSVPRSNMAACRRGHWRMMGRDALSGHVCCSLDQICSWQWCRTQAFFTVSSRENVVVFNSKCIIMSAIATSALCFILILIVVCIDTNVAIYRQVLKNYVLAWGNCRPLNMLKMNCFFNLHYQHKKPCHFDVHGDKIRK